MALLLLVPVVATKEIVPLLNGWMLRIVAVFAVLLAASNAFDKVFCPVAVYSVSRLSETPVREAKIEKE